MPIFIQNGGEHLQIFFSETTRPIGLILGLDSLGGLDYSLYKLGQCDLLSINLMSRGSKTHSRLLL
jgi:hypothetical protein